MFCSSCYQIGFIMERLPVIHDVKVWSRFWENLTIEEKNFELRKLDRDYQVNDYLRLNFYSEDLKEVIETEKPKIAKIQYILKDAEMFGLQKEYGILALKFYTSFSFQERVEFLKTQTQTV